MKLKIEANAGNIKIFKSPPIKQNEIYDSAAMSNVHIALVLAARSRLVIQTTFPK